MNLFCGHQGKTLCQIESHLPPKDAVGSSSGSIVLLGTVIQDMLK
jgi:hypothetical protein